jgi:hypothetical protein
LIHEPATGLIAPVTIAAPMPGTIHEGQSDREIRQDLDADATALTIAAAILGLLVQSLVDPLMDLTIARREYSAALQRSLAPTG